MKKVFMALLAASLSAMGQTTVTLNTTVQTANIARPGINMAGDGNYGLHRKTRDLNVANNGYMPLPYWYILYNCATGGTQSTTNWYAGSYGDYPANFFVNYGYQTITATGGTRGSGTVTASTASSSGQNLTLSPAISAACTTGGSTAEDQILLSPPTTPNLSAVSFSEYFGGHTSGSGVFETNDLMNSNFAMAVDITSGSITFYIDPTVAQTQSTASTTALPYINFNGTYTTVLGAKCVTAGCSVAYSVGRVGGTTFQSGSVSPSTSAWTAYSPTFTASETGSQTLSAALTITITGEAKIQYASVIESSTDPSNTTVLRDNVFHDLQKINPGTLRFMSTFDWGSDNAHLTQTQYGLLGVSGFNTFVREQLNGGITFNDDLNICLALKVSHCWLTSGNMATDYSMLINWLSTSGWNATAAANGFDIEIEIGNEAWNSSTPVAMLGNDGQSYGAFAGAQAAAMKAATGYNSAVDKIVFDGWAAGSQSYGIYGWITVMMNSGAGCTLSVRTNCPDYIDAGFYTLNTLSSLTDVFGDEYAENYNIGTKTGYSTGGSFDSAKQTNAYTTATWNTPLVEYEFQYSPTSGSATPTQLQMNQITSSSGNGLNEYMHGLLFLASAGVQIGNEFAFGDEPFNGSINSTVQTAWSSMQLMPGTGGTEVFRPVSIYQAVGNTAIGTNNCLMNPSLSGVPTYSYAGGQGGTIDSNSAVPYVQIFVFADCATKTHWTEIAFNGNESSTEAITQSYGSGTAPVGNITKTVVGGTTNALTDTNANSTMATQGTAAVVVIPSSTTISTFTGDTLAAGSMATYTWSTSGTSNTSSTAAGITISGVTVN